MLCTGVIDDELETALRLPFALIRGDDVIGIRLVDFGGIFMGFMVILEISSSFSAIGVMTEFKAEFIAVIRGGDADCKKD
jgi:hypothetical protein